VTTLASVLLLAYAALTAFRAWGIIRRRSEFAMGFMAAAATLVLAGVAVAFGHWASVPFALVGVLLASVVSYLDARAAGGGVVAWRHALRAAFGALVVVAVLVARAGVS
jgi:hypothetical protein